MVAAKGKDGVEITIDIDTLQQIIQGAVSQELKAPLEKINELSQDIAVLKARDQQGLCPQNCPCSFRINALETQGTRVEASSKSAHHRIDGLIKTVIVTAGVVGGIISAVGMIISSAIQVYSKLHL